MNPLTTRFCFRNSAGRLGFPGVALLAVVAAPLTVPLRAADGIDTWEVRQPPASAASIDFQGVACGNGRWVIVGESGTILSSSDGVEWAPEQNPAGTAKLDDIAFGNGVFVAIGSGNQVVLTSPDGKQWTKQPLKVGGGLEIIHDGARFVALAAGGFLSTSVDGVAWEFPVGVPTLYVDVGGIAFGNGSYVEAGYMRTGKPTDLWSCVGLTNWQFRDAKSSQNLFGVGFGLGQFVAVGQKGTLITSPDGAAWTPRVVPHTGFIWEVCGGGPYLAAACQWGRVLTSPNGVDWTKHETGLAGHLTDIGFGNGTFVAVGWDGQIVQSGPILPTSGDEHILLSVPQTDLDEVRFTFTGTIDAPYEIQTSTNCLSWIPVGSVTCTTSPMNVTLHGQTDWHRFYRVLKR